MPRPSLHIANRDVPVLAARALSVSERLQPFAPDLARLIPTDPTPLTTLATLARALRDADTATRDALARTCATDARADVAATFALRRRLHAAALTLDAWGSLPAAAPARKNFARARTHAGIYGDIRALVQILRAALPATEKLTPFRAADLESATRDADDGFARLASVRVRTPQAVRSARSNRRLSLAALLDKYDEIRVAMTLLRHAEQDISALMPPLRTR